jgi:hypothetical protein
LANTSRACKETMRTLDQNKETDYGNTCRYPLPPF